MKWFAFSVIVILTVFGTRVEGINDEYSCSKWPTTCLLAGDKCDSDYLSCDINGNCTNMCAFPLLCRNTDPKNTDKNTRICLTSVANTKCDASSDCTPSMWLLEPPATCVRGICNNFPYLPVPGEACTSSCYPPVTCTLEGTCLGIPEGGLCGSRKDCGTGLYCNEERQRCEPSLREYEDCNGLITACEVGTTCDFFTSVCIPLAKQNESAACTYDLQCAPGLYCINRFCTKVNASAEGKLCETTLDCPPGTKCLCDATLGQSVCKLLKECRQEYRVYLDCALENECHLDSDIYYPDSCVATHCMDEYYEYWNCNQLNSFSVFNVAESCVLKHPIDQLVIDPGCTEDSFSGSSAAILYPFLSF